MIAQIKIDIGDQVAELAAARLCLDENAPSVKQQAETLGVTRARVYQLLEDCAKVMDVRWPEGRWLLAPLTTRFGTSGRRRSACCTGFATCSTRSNGRR